MKIGVPKALLYYIYYPLWWTFFHELGCDVVVSDDTNKAILDDGIKDFTDDACLPIKIFRGHVLQLMDKVDALFIPRLVSINKREYICPKFCGLPEMIKYSAMLSVDVMNDTLNIHNGNGEEEWRKFFFSLGLRITDDKNKIKLAGEKALKAWDYYRIILKSGLTPLDVLKNNDYKMLYKLDGPANNVVRNVVGIIGHPYVIYDTYLSMDLIKKVKSRGFHVITPENIDEKYVENEASKLPKQIFYTFGKSIYGAAMHMISAGLVKGLVYMSAFGCGIDAFITELIQRKGKKLGNVPIMVLNIDEHTGEAGIDTRMEAFLDMIKWRDQHESYFSASR